VDHGPFCWLVTLTARSPLLARPQLHDGQEKSNPKRSAADVMVEIVAAAGATLFHTPDLEAYAAVPRDGRREVHQVRGTGFRRWLAQLYFEAAGRAANGEAMANALGTLEGIAVYRGEEHPVHVRTAASPDGGLVLDLCDAAWRAVALRPSGWEVLAVSPVYFRRGQSMRPLPVPARGGNLATLRRFLNVKTDDDWLLVSAWLAAALRPAGPYPVLHLKGEAGAAKSTGGRVLRRLVDPNAADLRSQPREERDLAVASRHGWCLALDNLSAVPVWLSDALCRMATGGGFSARALYTNDEEVVFDFVRPVLVTSIEDVVGQPDLLDRTLGVELAPIPDAERRTEADLWAAFEEERPGILGGLLDAVSAALALLPVVAAENNPVPRMADFALFGEAVARFLGAEPGHFLGLLRDARGGADQAALEDSPIAALLVRFVRDRGVFTGTATELLDALAVAADDQTRRRRDWPGTPTVLSGLLRRLGSALRRFGIGIAFTKVGHARTRTVILTYRSAGAEDRPSAAPAPPGNLFTESGLSADDPHCVFASAGLPADATP